MRQRHAHDHAPPARLSWSSSSGRRGQRLREALTEELTDRLKIRFRVVLPQEFRHAESDRHFGEAETLIFFLLPGAAGVYPFVIVSSRFSSTLATTVHAANSAGSTPFGAAPPFFTIARRRHVLAVFLQRLAV